MSTLFKFHSVPPLLSLSVFSMLVVPALAQNNGNSTGGSLKATIIGLIVFGKLFCLFSYVNLS